MSHPEFNLFHYWRSSCSWRVRWAMDLKGIPFKPVAISLLNDDTEQPDHVARNPAKAVPVLQWTVPSTNGVGKAAETKTLTESLAIIQYLESLQPTPNLFPNDPYLKARAWALAEIINSGTHPLQNPTVLEMHAPGTSPEAAAARKVWAQQVIRNGLQVFQTLCKDVAGDFSVGNVLTIADLCLIPQIYNAKRFDVDLKEFPLLVRINEKALETPSALSSHPDRYEPQAT